VIKNYSFVAAAPTARDAVSVRTAFLLFLLSACLFVCVCVCVCVVVCELLSAFCYCNLKSPYSCHSLSGLPLQPFPALADFLRGTCCNHDCLCWSSGNSRTEMGLLHVQ